MLTKDMVGMLSKMPLNKTDFKNSIEIAGYSFENFISEFDSFQIQLMSNFEIDAASNSIHLGLKPREQNNFSVIDVFFLNQVNKVAVAIIPEDVHVLNMVLQKTFSVFFPISMYPYLKQELDNAFFLNRYSVMLNTDTNPNSQTATFQFNPL